MNKICVYNEKKNTVLQFYLMHAKIEKKVNLVYQKDEKFSLIAKDLKKEIQFFR